MEHLSIVDIAVPVALVWTHALPALCPEKTGNLVSKERKYWMRKPVTDGKKSITFSSKRVITAGYVRRYALMG